jgi:hypothetical protein
MSLSKHRPVLLDAKEVGFPIHVVQEEDKVVVE